MATQNNLLSPDELTALTEGIKDGLIEVDTGYNTQARVSKHDLTSEDSSLGVNVSSIDMINERFIRMFRFGLLEVLRTSPRVNPTRVQIVKYGDYLKELKPPLAVNLVRITPVYRDFFQVMGATVITTAPGEVYTALERGVVDGYGWPLTGLFDQNWQKMTKFRVEPGFYNAEVSLVVNLDVWKKLNPKQRELLQKHMLEIEADNTAYWKKNSEDEIKRQDQAGIQVIKFDPATAKQYLDKAYDSGWAGVIKNSPEYGPKLKQALTK